MQDYLIFNKFRFGFVAKDAPRSEAKTQAKIWRATCKGNYFWLCRSYICLFFNTLMLVYTRCLYM